MKTKLLSLLLLILCFSMSGKPVDENRARGIGLYFLQHNTNSDTFRNISTLSLAHKVNANIGDAMEDRVIFYVFNVDTVGYVIVAGDDTVTPILGYSDQGNFISNDMPSNVKKWLETYKNEIIYVVENGLRATDEINKLWNIQYYSKNGTAKLSSSSVSPLIQTRWDQSPYYNAQCPSGSVTGCVATAMAQVMKFWNYPATGSGFHSYNHPQYGTLSANFGSTTYQWGSMPNKVTSANSAVATLMSHCGVSVDMNYSPQSSGAAGATKVQPALISYFGYQNATIGLRSNYSDSDWINILKTELDSGRPMYYEGAGGGSGHAFVCDGYDNSNYFHFNWGWGGYCDGYFQVNALNPTGTGTGGGSGQYNSNQKIVKGIQPPTSAQNYNLNITTDVNASSSNIGYGSAFSITTNIENNGTNTFNGDYCAGIFDQGGNFIDFVATITGVSLQGGYTYQNNLVFNSTGNLKFLPGSYNVYVYYRPTGGNWKQIHASGLFTYEHAEIKFVNQNVIALNSKMTVSPNTVLTQGQSASVNLNIINNGSSAFVGQYKVGLYNLDGSLVQDIAIKNETNGLPSGYTYQSPYLTFNTSSITADPGSYLIALLHKTATGDWELTGSTSSFINPVGVTIIQAPYLSDIYENNDAFNQSYNLPLTFSGNNTSVKTNGSNCHVETDNDYYKIVMPSGYNYTITPRLHDSFNSGNGNTYSLDALFSYSTDGVNWSNAFDDVVSGNIAVNNGGTIYFRTAPYFQGDTGTYLLDIALSRTTALGIDENQFTDNIKIYPNPAKDFIIIDSAQFDGEVHQIDLVNIQGQNVFTTNALLDQTSSFRLPLNNLTDGVYLLQVKTNNGFSNRKIIISK